MITRWIDRLIQRWYSLDETIDWIFLVLNACVLVIILFELWVLICLIAP